ncbi:MAG TPA: alpha/beta hydrolase [Gemmataceae bacterium]|jgi:acetyl esterase/lipase
MRKVLQLSLLACPFFLSIACAVRAQDAPTFLRTPDVIYGRKAGLALTMDVFAPKEKANGLGVIIVISGGWRSHPGAIRPELCYPFLKRGYTVFAVVHGTQPKFTIPEILDDVHRSVRFIRYHAKDYRVDPDRLGISGSSAGGHLSLMMGTDGIAGDTKAKDPVERVSSRVQAVACFFPPTDFLNWGKPGAVLDTLHIDSRFRAAVDFKELDGRERVFKRVTDEKKIRELLGRISPITHVSPDDAPTLIIHGDADKLVPLQQSEEMIAKLKEAGVPAKLIVKKGYGHGWITILKDEETLADWFDQYLKDKPKASQ